MEEYLQLEERLDVKHEYVGGVAHAMAGARVSHNRMVTRIAMALAPTAQRSGCDTFIADMKLRVGDLAIYYPDVMVCCDAMDDDELYRTNPCLIVEVLSASTATIDRREKLHSYLAVPGLLTYLIVDPDRPEIEAHIRSTPTSPWHHEAHGLDGAIFLPCPNVAIDVNTLYDSSRRAF
jgi:Uma2 family endonuclease